MSKVGAKCFEFICKRSPMIFCPVLDLPEPTCYARNADLWGFLIFQPLLLLILFVSWIMTIIMVHNIKKRYTAVGRKEMIMFFYSYMGVIILEFFLYSNIIKAHSYAYVYFGAFYMALVSSTFWLLLLNGFVGFQLAEDGSFWSIWGFRLSFSAVFAIFYLLSFGTFSDNFGLKKNDPTPLFFAYFCFNITAVIIYTISQVCLVLTTIDNRWPLGNICLGTIFILLSQIVLLFGTTEICTRTIHYIDGLLFSACFVLLSVMMHYKYWDSLTSEDLEFFISESEFASSNPALRGKFADAKDQK